MLDDLKNNGAIRGLLCLIACLLCGLAAARYIAPVRWATLTLGGSAIFGLLLGWLVYRAKPAQPKGVVTDRHDGAQTAKHVVEATKSSLEWPQTPALLLVLNLVTEEQMGVAAETSSFIGSLELENGESDAIRHGFRTEELPHATGCVDPARAWVIRNRDDAVVAEYIEIPLQLQGSRAEGVATGVEATRTVLEQLGLAGRRAQWSNFRRAIRSGQIPQHPDLKAVLLCCPAKNLFGGGPIIASVSPVLLELANQIRAKFPLYIVISGLETERFNEFANYLSRDDSSALRSAVGAAYVGSVRTESDVEVLVQGVFARLRRRCVSILKAYRDEQQGQLDHSENRAAVLDAAASCVASIFEFPRNLTIRSGLIANFGWNVVKAASRGYFGPVLRGVFFSGLVFRHSDVADKTVDHRMTQFRRAFVFKLLTEDLPCSDAAEGNSTADRSRSYRELRPRQRRNLIWTLRAVSVLAALAAIGSLVSLVLNAVAVRNARVSINELATCIEEQRGPAACLSVLEKIRVSAVRPDSWATPFSRFGLYQGGRVRSELALAYFAGAANIMVDPVLASLEGTLVDHHGPSPPNIAIVDALRLYQILYRRVGCGMDPGLLTHWGPVLWSAKAGPVPGAATNDVIQKEFAYLADGANYSRVPTSRLRLWNADLVAQAQDDVAKARGFTDTYSDLLHDPHAGTISIAEVLNDEPDRVPQLLKDHAIALSGNTTIGAVYSVEKYADLLNALNHPQDRQSSDPCISGGRLTASSTTAVEPPGQLQASARYTADYRNAWKIFLQNTKVKPFALSEASERVSVLASERSPLLAALAFASHNTAFSQESTTPGVGAQTGSSDRETIARMFEPVRKIVPPGPERWTGGWWNEGYRPQLLKLKDAMVVVAADRSNSDARKNVLDICKAGIETVDLLPFPSGTDDIDRITKDLLKSPFQLAERILPVEPPREVDAMLTGFCRELAQLRRKFPLNPQGKLEDQITEADLRKVLDPMRGSFLRFSDRGFVQRTSDVSRWQPGPQATGFVLEPRFLAFLDAITETSRYLFGPGFEFSVTITPAPADMRVELTIGGTQHATEQGTKNVFSYRWPGPEPSSGLYLATPGTRVDYPGILGLYSMIQNNERDASTGRVRLSKPKLPGGGVLELMHGGKPASVDLIFQGLPHGLNGIFNGLECPPTAARR